MIKVNLKGSIKEYEAGTTIAEIAQSIGAGLYKAACVGKINGELADLRTPVTEDCEVEILTFDSDDGKKAYWHTCSHIMAQAVKHLFPETGFGIGPAIENGFFYDFDLPRSITPEDLEKIEAEMKKIIKQNLPLERFELSPEEAKALMEKDGQKYKVELIEEHSGKGEKISLYRQGDFTDLCAGPHLMSTGSVKAVKLTNCTGAYWRADAKNKMLQRIYGIAFPKASELDEYLVRLEEAKKRLCIIGRVDTLEYLYRGGRLSKTSAIAGTLLNIKPVLTVRDGQLAVLHEDARRLLIRIAAVLEFQFVHESPI